MADVDDYVLEPSQWPDMPSVHRTFLDDAIPRLRDDERLVGLAVGGSFISRTLDEHSDLDLVVVSRAQPNGVRRVERSVPERVAALRSTLAAHDRQSCSGALSATVALYTELRRRLAPPTLQRRTEAEQAVWDWLGIARPDP